MGNISELYSMGREGTEASQQNHNIIRFEFSRVPYAALWRIEGLAGRRELLGDQTARLEVRGAIGSEATKRMRGTILEGYKRRTNLRCHQCIHRSTLT